MSDFMKALLGSMGNESERPTLNQIQDATLDHYRSEWTPIPNLKPGDRVMWKGSEFRDRRTPEVMQVVTVFRTFPVKTDYSQSSGNSHFIGEYDFSVLYSCSADGELVEMAYDSRRFKRAE